MTETIIAGGKHLKVEFKRQGADVTFRVLEQDEALRHSDQGRGLLGKSGTFAPKPEESDEAPAARLDPEYMSKHPELWEVGDEARCSHAETGHIISTFFTNNTGLKCVAFCNGGSWAREECCWRSRPRLPDDTLVRLHSTGLLLYASHNECGLYELCAYPGACGGAYSDMPRSTFTALMLPPEGDEWI